MQDATSFPADLDACHTLLSNNAALLVEQASAIVDLQSSREQLAQQNEELNFTIQKLLARLYGPRSERHVVDPNQQQLDFGDDPAVQDGLADAAAEAEELVQEYTVRRTVKKRPQPRSEEFPAHLLRYEVTADVPAEQQQCATHGVSAHGRQL